MLVTGRWVRQARRVFFDTAGAAKFSDDPASPRYFVKTDRARAAELRRLEQRLTDSPRRKDPETENMVAARVKEVLGREGPRQHAYSLAVKVLAIFSSPWHVNGMFYEMQAQGVRPTPETAYWTLYALSRRKGHLKEGLAVVDALAKTGCTMGVKLEQCLLRLQAVNGDHEAAKRRALEMQLKGVKLGMEGHNGLLYTCSSMEEAGEVIEGMRLDGLEPNIQTYNLLLRVCRLTSNAKVAEALIKKLRDEGVPIAARHYTTLLRIYGDLRDLRGLSRTHDRMLHSGTSVDVKGYYALLMALVHWADDAEVMRLAETTASSALEICRRKDAGRIWVALMRFHAARHELDKCERLYEQVKRNIGESRMLEVARGLVEAAKGGASRPPPHVVSQRAPPSLRSLR
eukprot:TRINITY_DN3167_c1_g1_i1.p1 TRINITY_DN3167_c1_g1~~TRINITY_DN3167_c1_g1_i1.p1  ORF type:complete len:425 (+),score=124.84 TRINITY_DN3167_c1_g1_i1:73-1275(+)